MRKYCAKTGFELCGSALSQITFVDGAMDLLEEHWLSVKISSTAKVKAKENVRSILESITSLGRLIHPTDDSVKPFINISMTGLMNSHLID